MYKKGTNRIPPFYLKTVQLTLDSKPYCSKSKSVLLNPHKSICQIISITKIFLLGLKNMKNKESQFFKSYLISNFSTFVDKLTKTTPNEAIWSTQISPKLSSNNVIFMTVITWLHIESLKITFSYEIIVFTLFYFKSKFWKNRFCISNSI